MVSALIWFIATTPEVHSYPELWRSYWPLMRHGLLVTLQLAAVGVVAALALGLALALLRQMPFAPVRWLIGAYVNVTRGTPEILQLFVIFFGLTAYGIRLTPLVAAVVWLAAAGAACVRGVPSGPRSG
jgi:His/Glu/Gln/Arg/opine family amino acid ABC transporter permease subunit